MSQSPEVKFVELPYKKLPVGQEHVIVVTIRDRMSRDDAFALTHTFKEFFGTEQKVLVIHGNISVGSLPKSFLLNLAERKQG